MLEARSAAAARGALLSRERAHRLSPHSQRDEEATRDAERALCCLQRTLQADTEATIAQAEI